MGNSLENNMLKSLIDNLEVSINVFDLNGKRIFVNPYFYYLAGRPKGSKFSPDISEVKYKKNGRLTKRISEAIKLGKMSEIHDYFYRSYSPKARKKYFDFLIGPLRDDEGKIIGAYTMVKDVTDRFLATKKLMKLKNNLEKKVLERTEKIEKISKEKNMLVSDIAHDIKTILTIIKGNLEMLKLEKKFNEPMEIECYSEIDKEMGKMIKISSDLVTIANSQQYAETLKFEKIDLVILIKELIKKYDAISKGRIKIVFSPVPKQGLFIAADRDKLSIMICNIIENAIKFRQKKAKLQIFLKKTEKKAHLIFKDNGIGIESEKIGHIFSPFFQASKANKISDKKLERGFGLGLTICKKIVDAHKGGIFVKSKGQGKGTIVEILLPIWKRR